MLELGYEHKGPAAVRYPRGNGPGADIIKDAEKIEIGKARLIKEENSKIAILSFGSVLDIASEVSEKLKTSLFDMRFVKPLDEKALIEISKKYDLLVTIEENVIAGGAGSAVNEFVHSNSLNVDLLNVGIPDSFPIIGSPNDQKDSYGLNAESIIKRIKTKID
jgi:1-deoxy-D-xylulose-5-phosphate synthase